MTDKKKQKTGRPPKENPKKNMWSIRFTDDENALLESLCQIFRVNNEARSETLERVIVYALKVYWLRFLKDESKRKQKALDDWAFDVGAPSRRSFEDVRRIVDALRFSSSSSVDPTEATNGGGDELSEVPPSSALVPSALSGWFDEGVKNG